MICGGSGEDGGSGNDRMQIDGSSSSVTGGTQYNLFGMSDDGMNTDRDISSTTDVCQRVDSRLLSHPAPQCSNLFVFQFPSAAWWFLVERSFTLEV